MIGAGKRRPIMTHRRFSVLLLALAALPAFAQQKKPEPPKSVRLYIFDCGTLDNADTSRYQLKKEEIATHLMSVPCFLIAHPKGTLMWDTGVVPDSEFKAGQPGTLRYATSKTPLKTQMAALGYAPSDINYLALSHFHWDHVANANAFAGATWLVRPAERDFMFSDAATERSIPTSYSALKNAKTTLLTKDEYDVFGDGTVILKAAPGHSPGHQVLFLKFAKTGPVVLSGDLWHYPEERKLHKMPAAEQAGGQTGPSRDAVEAFMKKNNAQLWIQHDYTNFAKLKKAPQYYE
jgi:N-acyl homoserine lactone hydrolase